MERPTAVELLRRIQKLEECEGRLSRQISNTLQEEEEYKFMNILESLGRTVYMFDANNRIVYWNRMAQTLYGYTPAEALGKTAPEIIISPKYSDLATLIIQRALHGETWSGQFHVRTKFGYDKFPTVCPSLKALKLTSMDFDNGVMLSYALKMIRHFTNLQTIEIQAARLVAEPISNPVSIPEVECDMMAL